MGPELQQVLEVLGLVPHDTRVPLPLQQQELRVGVAAQDDIIDQRADTVERGATAKDIEFFDCFPS